MQERSPTDLYLLFFADPNEFSQMQSEFIASLSMYLKEDGDQVWGKFEAESLMSAIVKYGRAIRYAASMFKRLSQMKDEFDFEVSVDETDSPTTPLEHFFIASELVRLGVLFTSLAPRFIGRFEKGVDYIGDLNALDIELEKHAS